MGINIYSSQIFMSIIVKHMIRLKSWGNYKKVLSQLHFIKSGKISPTLGSKKYIPYGNGRSYGDCALQTNSLQTTKSDKIISFDQEKGILRCESGVLLTDILEKVLPQKWFLPVTPGTRYITAGGAIAADVHGKNHHSKGCFGQHIISLKLLLPNGDVMNCSKTEHTEMFNATCGGMGLTGVILEAMIQLIPIKSTFIHQKTIRAKNLKETFEAFKRYQDVTYSVAWIDASAKGSEIGKGLLFTGEHCEDNDFSFSFLQKKYIPRWFPSFLLNPISIKLYNKYYYSKFSKTIEKVPLQTFFYPLDSIKHWNRIYGAKGFLQYQVVLPKEKSYDGIKAILQEVIQGRHTSYLTVLKLLGKENENYLSFPREGYTISMDFKIKKGVFEFLNQLDTIVLQYGGRGYLAKDARMSTAFFETGYPKLQRFKNIREQYNLEQLQSLQSKRLGL